MNLDRRDFLRAGATAAAAQLVACGTRSSAPEPRAIPAAAARIEIRGVTLEQSRYSYAL